MSRIAIIGFVAGLLAVFASNGWASLHHPEEPFAVPVSENGTPQALPFDAFASRRADLMNAVTPTFPLDDSSKKGRTIRGRLKDEIARLEKLPNPTERDRVALTVDLLRFGRINEAEEPLRNLRRGYLPNITLAHVAAAQEDWGRAHEFLDIADEETPPKEFPGLSVQQLAWQVKLNRGPLKKFFKLRLAEPKIPKRAVEDELPDRIFDVNFVNAAGVYEPGVLAPAEQAKLPPDALAIVQQFVLWFPHDVRSYWLLGELYAARGEFAVAKKIMDQCVDPGRYSNRKVLMQHREAVTKAAKEKGTASEEPLLAPPAPPPPADAPPPAAPISMRDVWVYFGVVAAIALFAFGRAMMKRKRGNNCGSVG